VAAGFAFGHQLGPGEGGFLVEGGECGRRTALVRPGTGEVTWAV
jgi:hypothetical protein